MYLCVTLSPQPDLFLQVLSQGIVANGAFFGIRQHEKFLEPDLHVADGVLLLFVPRHVLLVSLRRRKDGLEGMRGRERRKRREYRRTCPTRRRPARCWTACARGRESASGRSARPPSPRRAFCIRRGIGTWWGPARHQNPSLQRKPCSHAHPSSCEPAAAPPLCVAPARQTHTNEPNTLRAISSFRF